MFIFRSKASFASLILSLLSLASIEVPVFVNNYPLHSLIIVYNVLEGLLKPTGLDKYVSSLISSFSETSQSNLQNLINLIKTETASADLSSAKSDKNSLNIPGGQNYKVLCRINKMPYRTVMTSPCNQSKHELLEIKIILMTELMAAGRDSSFMIRNTSFTKQVHFYICKIQIKPKLYPLSRDRNIVHHIADTASIALPMPS